MRERETHEVHEGKQPLGRDNAAPGHGRAGTVLDCGMLVDEVAIREKRRRDYRDGHEYRDILSTSVSPRARDKRPRQTWFRPQIAHVRPSRMTLVIVDRRERKTPTLRETLMVSKSRSRRGRYVHWTQMVALSLGDTTEVDA